MSLFAKSLTILLSFGLLCSGPSAGSRRHAEADASWWEAGKFREFQAQAGALHRVNDYAGLEQLYRTAEQYARQIGQMQARISYLTALGNSYLMLFRYREAIETYREATRLAEESGDWEAAGAIAPGLVSVYFLVGDYAAARQASENGLQSVARMRDRPYYEAALKLQYARLAAGSGDLGPAVAAIEATHAQPPETEPHRVRTRFETEAEAWSVLGEERLRGGDLEAAETALAEGLRLRRLLAPQNLYSSYRLLGALRLMQAEQAGGRREDLLREAESFTALALEAAGHAGSNLTTFLALRQRGMIRGKQGMAVSALEDFAAAAALANRWRLSVPQADSSLTGANALLDQEVFRTFAEAAADQALSSGDARWVRESFLAAEQNRAASLRQTRELVPVWRERLPDRYWAILSQIRRQEGAQLIKGRPAFRSERLHLELTEMEAASGIAAMNREENFQSPDALILLQEILGDDEVLLSIQAGKRQSYLWAVTRSSLRIYKLRGSDEIRESIGRFRRAVLEHSPEAQELGASLYESLFGQLNALESAKASWLLSLDGPFFELPFAALRDASTAREPAYLIERHALQIVPGAFLLRKQSAREAARSEAGETVMPSSVNSQSRYVGFGDPVYNTADPRFEVKPWYRRWPRPEIPGQLNRLVASAEEVDRSARAWREAAGDDSTALVFQGPQATTDTFLKVLSAATPSTIHLATHVLTGDTRREQAFLAFSSAPGGSPELLATSDVARLHVPGALVVMTGCSSGTGDVVAGAGILGLTRAWLAAGATGVVATGWAVEDARGGLVPNFYRHLHEKTAAEALRRSQMEMLHSGNWQSDPAYWASFQLTGVTR